MDGFESSVDRRFRALEELGGQIRQNGQVVEQTVRRLDKAFRNFFRRCKSGEKPGFPRFKNRFNSLDFTAGDGVKVKGKKLYIQHIGDVKIILHRELPKYSQVTVKYQNGQFFATFIVEAKLKTFEPSDKNLGIDFGLKTFITTSDGEKIDSPKFLKRSLKQLKRLSSKYSQQTKGTAKRQKYGRALVKKHCKIANQRADFNHKLANQLIEQNGLIAIENLDIQKLSSGEISNVNRTYNDVSWAQFAQMLTYKAANAGRKIVRVNPANTSKTCHNCGKIHTLSLEDRIISCECGYTEDRDVNAAKNILALGLVNKVSRLGLQSQVSVGTSQL